MKRIKLTQEKVALVDDADFEFLNQWKWFYHQTGYAKSCHRYMHRLINKTPKGFHTDHINRNKLDNRRKNLRTATCSQNLFNSKLQINNTSGHRGVYWYERYKKWEVYITVMQRRVYLGRFQNLNDALMARKKALTTYNPT